MTPLAALGFVFVGSVIGFLAGMFVTVAHPVYLKHWHDLQKSKESRRKCMEALDKITDLISENAAKEYAASRLDKHGKN